MDGTKKKKKKKIISNDVIQTKKDKQDQCLTQLSSEKFPSEADGNKYATGYQEENERLWNIPL